VGRVVLILTLFAMLLGEIMKLPKYNSNKTYEQLIKKVKKRGRDYDDDLDGLESQIVNFALEYLKLNLKNKVYLALYDHVKYNDPTAETSKYLLK